MTHGSATDVPTTQNDAEELVSGSRARRRAATTRLLEEAAAAATEEERSALLDEVVVINMEVAGDVARRYYGRGIPDEDLDQVANLGLVNAVQRFDPHQGHDFLSYAVPTIRGEVRRYFRDMGWTIRPPRSVQELQARIGAAQGELCQQLGRSPRPSEIAAHLDADVELVRESLAARGCFTPTSLDTPLDDDDPGPLARQGGPDPGYASAEARVALQKVMIGLTPRERRILEMRFFRDCTQAEIGAEVGVTQMQVSRLLKRILGTLHERLVDEPAAAA